MVPYNKDFLEGFVYDVPRWNLGSQWLPADLETEGLNPLEDVEYWNTSQAVPMVNGPIGPVSDKSFSILIYDMTLAQSFYPLQSSTTRDTRSAPVETQAQDIQQSILSPETTPATPTTSRQWTFIPPPELTSGNTRRSQHMKAPTPQLSSLRVKIDPLSHGKTGQRKRSMVSHILCSMSYKELTPRIAGLYFL